MTTQEKAKLLSEKCVDEICALDDCDDAVMIADRCCLTELLNVVEAAQRVNDNLNEFGAVTDEIYSNSLHDSLLALRAKLPKEML